MLLVNSDDDSMIKSMVGSDESTSQNSSIDSPLNIIFGDKKIPPKCNNHDAEVKRIRNFKRSVPIRIIRTDIRRKFPEIIVNTLNSYDPTLFLSFLQDFCRPELLVKKKLLQSHGLPPIDLQLTGGFQLLQTYFTALFKISPDQIIEITSPDLLIRQAINGNSEIRFTFRVKGTKFFPYTPDDIAKALLSTDSSDSSENSMSSNNQNFISKKIISNSSDHILQSMFSNTPSLQHYIPIQTSNLFVEGCVNVYLDPNMRLYYINFDGIGQN